MRKIFTYNIMFFLKRVALISIALFAFFVVTALNFKVDATSHYSYEHAHELKNLIEWRDYESSTFTESIQQNKPIFLFLTAPSWCYWCQVYESEEYLFHPDIIEVLNNSFIPIYVDADIRQDLTRQYLEGGWPSTTVLDPGRNRLYGFSGVRLPSNMKANLLEAVNYVNGQGFSNSSQYNYEKVPPKIPTIANLNQIISNYQSSLLSSFDPIYGGFGSGQKFPQPRSIDYALDMFEKTREDRWLNVARKTLDGQYTDIDKLKTNYKLFDPVEGGFHRYGTTVTWTPPHFEKMLYDNVRLLRAYSHLLDIDPNNSKADEVVGKTHEFINLNWWDEKNGGFYATSDVHGEDHYFGEVNRPLPKPRVEKTKFSDWNGEAITTYLWLWRQTGNLEHKEKAQKTLDFFENEMMTENGLFHSVDIDGKKEVTGSIIDNSYMLLAFVEGYEVLGDEKYLKTAQMIADYMLDSLYDWNSGGFFERNSVQRDIYAPGENILLTKPVKENGVAAFAFAKLYQSTKKLEYLNASIKTIGSQINQIPQLDWGYYYVKAVEYSVENNLISKLENLEREVEILESKKIKDFWLNDLVGKGNKSGKSPKFIESNIGLVQLDGSLFILVIVAFVAGLLSFVSPCALPILPAFTANVLRSSKKNVWLTSLFFFLGLSLIFVSIGVVSGLVGNSVNQYIEFFSKFAGIFLILLGLYILTERGFSGMRIKLPKRSGYLGSFLFGSTLGISWTPCVGPILVAILLLASTSGSAVRGGILLFAYSLGLFIPLLLISYRLNKIDKKGKVWGIIKGKELGFKFIGKKIAIHSSSLVSAIIFIVLGILIFNGSLVKINALVSTTVVQQWIYGIEDFILERFM